MYALFYLFWCWMRDMRLERMSSLESDPRDLLTRQRSTEHETLLEASLEIIQSKIIHFVDVESTEKKKKQLTCKVSFLMTVYLVNISKLNSKI